MIDLNCDLGEGYGAHPGGPDDRLVPLVTSANLACGGHAGDPPTMRRTCLLAVGHGVTIGAQVSYPDVLGFGRRFIDMVPTELADHVLAQIAALDAFARSAGDQVRYVKPHGALYHAVSHHDGQAAAVADAVAEWGSLPVLGMPGSVIERACDRRGLRFVTEGFADRAYASDGSLVPRGETGALVTDPARAATQARSLGLAGVESICVHSDTPGAEDLLRSVRRALEDDGHVVSSFVTRPAA